MADTKSHHDFVKTDPWVQEILVDPIGKDPLVMDQSRIVSQYGRTYPIVLGIPDLRPFKYFVGQDAQVWQDGQNSYEEWSGKIASDDSMDDYLLEISGVKEVYDAIPLLGRCLDVGGHQGRLRAFLAPGQEYLILDPYLNVFDGLALRPNLLKAFPCLRQPVNFLCGMAEHSPLKSCSFDTVHMRSVIDHFMNPELALLEAFRVLRPGGQLIVGLYVEGGMEGRLTLKETAKETIRGLLPYLGVHQFDDHHVWHPTYKELTDLISGVGFSIGAVHWQAQFIDRVCYVRAIKPAENSRMD